MAKPGLPLHLIDEMNCDLSEAHASTPGSHPHRVVVCPAGIVHDACNTISALTAMLPLLTR
eukprot:556251-Amphidinium_carterae.3